LSWLRSRIVLGSSVSSVSSGVGSDQILSTERLADRANHPILWRRWTETDWSRIKPEWPVVLVAFTRDQVASPDQFSPEEMNAAVKPVVFGGCAFLLAFTTINRAETDSLGPLASKLANGQSPERRSRDLADPFRGALKRNFLLEKDWETTLSGGTDEDLKRTIDEQPAEFWKLRLIAESAACGREPISTAWSA
jgi:hypothetical protein